MTSYSLQIAKDKNDLARLASETIATHLDLALDQKDRAQLALSGGSTPSAAYSLLGREHLPWDRVDVLLGDERWVDHEDTQSNCRMIRKTLMSGEPGSKAIFYPITTIALQSPDESAKEFALKLNEICNGEPPEFDLMVLGLGDDGHTASLFPKTDSLLVEDSWVTVGRGKGLERITMTFPVLSAARKVIFIVSGNSKKEALRRLLDPNEPIERTPAKLVRPRSDVVILADQEAAHSL